MSEPTAESVTVSPDEDPHERVAAAGEGGSLAWTPGTYELDRPLRPRGGQTWTLPFGATLVPPGDTPAVAFEEVEHVTLAGHLHVRDPAETSQGPAVAFRGSRGNRLSAVTVEGCATGVRFDGERAQASDNEVETLRIEGHREDGVVFSADARDNVVGVCYAKGAGENGHGVCFETSGVQGANKFGMVTSLRAGEHALALETFKEVWIGTAILDDPGADGLHVDGERGKRLFVGSLWTSTADRHGSLLGGHGEEPVSDLQIGRWYSWNNAGDAVRVEGNVERVQVGALDANNSRAGLRVVGDGAEGWHVGSLVSYANDDGGVVADAADGGIHVGRLFVDDGVDYAALSSANGDPLPESVADRSGRYVGERAFHDGSSDLPLGPAFWDGEEWTSTR